MLTRFYFFVVIIAELSIWFGWFGPSGTSEKLVLAGMPLVGLAPVIWVDTIIWWGFRSIRAVPMMAAIFLRSKRGSTSVGIVVVFLCFWFSPFAEHHSPYRFHMSAGLIFTVILLWLQPPCALVLGASSPPTGRALRAVSSVLFPFRVVALLDHRRTGYIVGTLPVFTDNLRTESDHHWRTTVDNLADRVPLIVLDARTDTEIVVSEIKQLLDKPERLSRTVFVVGPNGDAPALLAHDLSHNSAGIKTVTEESIGAVLKAWLRKSRTGL